MKRKTTIILALIAVTAIAATLPSNNTKIRIELTDKALDDKFEKTQAIIPVFEYQSNTIEEYNLISDIEKDELGTFEIKMPDMQGTVDTAYSFVFFGGSDKSPNKGYAMMVIGNYKRGTRPGLLYVDKNLNFDLSDDGPPDTMNYYDEFKDITFTNPNYPDGTYTVRLSRFPIGKNEKYKLLLGDHYKKHSGKKKFTSVNFSFREQRINVIRGEYKNGNDSFAIAVKDNNCNGLYNEEGVDLIYISSHKTDVFDRNAIPVNYDEKEPTSFEWNGKKYVLTGIDKSGKYIELEIDEDAELEHKLERCEKLSKFSFVTPDNRVFNINDFRKSNKLIYLYIYSTEDPTYKSDMDAMRTINEKYSDKVITICLNYGERPKIVWGSIYLDRLTWLVALSNTSINEELHVEETPTGVLVTNKRRVCTSGLTPQKLLAYFDSIAEETSE